MAQDDRQDKKNRKQVVQLLEPAMREVEILEEDGTGSILRFSDDLKIVYQAPLQPGTVLDDEYVVKYGEKYYTFYGYENLKGEDGEDVQYVTFFLATGLYEVS